MYIDILLAQVHQNYLFNYIYSGKGGPIFDLDGCSKIILRSHWCYLLYFSLCILNFCHCFALWYVGGRRYIISLCKKVGINDHNLYC